jgi:hypothetical protein
LKKIVLQWLIFLDRLNSLVSLGHPVEMIMMLFKICLLPGELFLDTSVHDQMYICLQRSIKQLSTATGTPWLLDKVTSPPFKELYSELIEQFQSSSYGDTFLANLLLLPCTRAYPADYRLTLLMSPSLCYMYISPKQLIVPSLHDFFYPVETDLQVLRQLACVFFRQRIQSDRTPFVYQWSLHHLHMKWVKETILVNKEEESEFTFFQHVLWTLRKCSEDVNDVNASKFKHLVEYSTNSLLVGGYND